MKTLEQLVMRAHYDDLQFETSFYEYFFKGEREGVASSVERIGDHDVKVYRPHTVDVYSPFFFGTLSRDKIYTSNKLTHGFFSVQRINHYLSQYLGFKYRVGEYNNWEHIMSNEKAVYVLGVEIDFHEELFSEYQDEFDKTDELCGELSALRYERIAREKAYKNETEELAKKQKREDKEKEKVDKEIKEAKKELDLLIKKRRELENK